MTEPACPFCKTNWPNLDIVTRPSAHTRIVRPLNPVTDGHVLVIHDQHTADAADNPHIAGVLMATAAHYVRFRRLQANIITSVGEAATQTVQHTHLHVVPRRPDDGLHLPWTGQRKAQR
ncbi:HIT family protein [Mycolicibacterium goodii]|uniref:HIT family protein n=1 Tax=Mycolicibacterium goodii TaxID=134601 RepID=UPI001BDC1F5F|nr:HIT family protein [Mycolicibacterium goodii]MBU8834156.1 HIT family protein [Mycolicibacterium goodii]